MIPYSRQPELSHCISLGPTDELMEYILCQMTFIALGLYETPRQLCTVRIVRVIMLARAVRKGD